MARSTTKDGDSPSVEANSKTETPDGSPSPHSEHSQTPSLEDSAKAVDESAPPLPVEQPPPLPDEQPPLPDEAPPTESADDGWQPMWDERAQAYYFYNRLTNVSQWENPRVPEVTATAVVQENTQPATGGYNPAIHGDYDPNADYAKPDQSDVQTSTAEEAAATAADAYAATGAFNRFTGKWQAADLTTERFSDESKSRRQMSAFFDVDAAANTHDGRSLKAERANKKVSKKELQAFKDKRRERKEEKRRAWLLD